MNFDVWFKIIFFFSSASVGILFSILQSRILASSNSDKLHNYFNIFSILLIVGALALIFFYSDELLNNSGEVKYFEVIILALSIIMGVSLLYFTKRYLFLKNIFKTTELDPIVNDFTSNADKNQVKLFGGDLNFFGEYPEQMDLNKQYTHLKALKFKKVLIICEVPEQRIQKVRYGKILSEIQGAELRFYHPESADLRVRGRMIQINGVNKLLMYKKIKSGVYKAIETDTADPDGALYNNIWELVWSMANQPNEKQTEEYKSLYKN